MADVHDTATRSYNMSRIRSKNSKPELVVRKYLFSHGYRYRLYVKDLPGKPDIVLPKYKTVVIIQGCFWHGHENCKYFVFPATRVDWWAKKINQTKINDKKNIELLINLGWKVYVIWECDLKSGKREKTLQNILEKIK